MNFCPLCSVSHTTLRLANLMERTLCERFKRHRLTLLFFVQCILLQQTQILVQRTRNNNIITRNIKTKKICRFCSKSSSRQSHHWSSIYWHHFYLKARQVIHKRLIEVFTSSRCICTNEVKCTRHISTCKQM